MMLLLVWRPKFKNHNLKKFKCSFYIYECLIEQLKDMCNDFQLGVTAPLLQEVQHPWYPRTKCQGSSPSCMVVQSSKHKHSKGRNREAVNLLHPEPETGTSIVFYYSWSQRHCSRPKIDPCHCSGKSDLKMVNHMHSEWSTGRVSSEWHCLAFQEALPHTSDPVRWCKLECFF